MFFADHCEQYKYTKIIVPLFLENSPSDYDDMQYYWDVNCDDYYQEDIYIGTNKIREIRFERIKKADCEYDNRAEWKLEMIIDGGKSEEETINILNELCTVLSLKFVCHYKHFQYCGFNGFAYDRLHMERRYAYEDKAFSDKAFSMYAGSIEIKTTSVIENKVFKLPKSPTANSELKDRLTDAFLRSLRCKDEISRYILLYYLFEIMYATDEYQEIKKQYELSLSKNSSSKNKCAQNNGDKKRSMLLAQYLQKEFGLKEYSSLGKTAVLDAKILENIITNRNNLTHRGDISKVSQLMYNHLLPILQEVIRKL